MCANRVYKLLDKIQIKPLFQFCHIIQVVSNQQQIMIMDSSQFLCLVPSPADYNKK